jgi:DnaB-like helicase N terminal domain
MIDSVSDPLSGGAADTGVDLKKSRRPKGDRRAPSAGSIDRLPPHDLQMEMGVLGCALLEPNQCIGECIEMLKDDGKMAFYDLRHQTIYETLAEMFNARLPVDLITVQQNLKDRQLLEQVGGIAERGEPFVLPRKNSGKISTAETDSDLHRCGRADL